MRRVAQVVQHLQPGGIETIVLDLARLGASADEVHVISLEGRPETILANWPRAGELSGRLHGMDKQPGVAPRLLMDLRRLFKRLNIDIVHTHHIGPLIYGGVAARLAGIRHVVHTEHDAWHLAGRRRRMVERLALSLARPALAADADIVADALRRAIPGCRPTVIWNGIDTDRFLPGDQHAARAALGLPLEGPIIGTAARLETVKGVDRLIEAFARLDTPATLAIAGSGSELANLTAQVTALGLDGRVNFLGRVDTMPRFYQALDVFCLASRHEGLPLSLLEAQASGVRAVALDVGGVRDALCPSTGYLIKDGDEAGLTTALDQAISLPCLTDPRDFVVASRNITAMVRGYDQLYAA
ncbi:MAG: glycosyltransferase [Rhodospirillales bacterium]|nr:glycosyltransferase [Rhodospirillales bacterium]